LNGTTGGGGNAEWGIGIEGGSGDVITQNTIQNCTVGINNSGFNNCTISQNSITGLGITGGQYGSRPQYGIVLAGCDYNSVTGNLITGISCDTAAWTGGYGVFLFSGSCFNQITNNTVSQCGSNGIALDATSQKNTLSLNECCDTSVGYGEYVNQYGGCGIQIAGSGNYISQNRVFDDRSGAAVTQQYGICMDSGAYNNVLINNQVYNNLKAQIYDTNVPENTMINNTGYNPVGNIAGPISGATAYLVDSGSNSTWISGRVYTNTGSPKELLIAGGTVSMVAQNGVTLFTATGCTVTLQPGDTFSITFSKAPTINVTGQ
jgi:parallel beta-helix repeat protein